MIILYIIGFFLAMGVLSLLFRGVGFVFNLFIKPLLNTAIGRTIMSSLKGVAKFAVSILVFTFLYTGFCAFVLKFF